MSEPLVDATRAAPHGVDFVLRLARALHSCGYAAPRLEEALEAASQRLGLEGQFFSTPTSIFAAFGPQDQQRTYLIRVQPADTDLGRLADLYETTKAVVEYRLSPADGAARVDQILTRKATYPTIVTILTFGLASAAAARFLGGGWLEIGVAAAIGLVIGLLSEGVRRLPHTSQIFEPTAAFIASALAALAGVATGNLSVFVATLAGLIVLLPGFTLTVAMRELATRHLASGTARLANAFVVFLGMAFGVALGNRLVSALAGEIPAGDPIPLPAWTLWLALAVAPVGFSVLLRAHARDMPWIVGAGVLAYIGGDLGGRVLGPELGLFVGALVIGAASNIYARLLDRPSSVPLVPGILLLVPGSVGFRSLASLLDQQVIAGVETAFRMIIMAVAISAGMLMANVIVPPGRIR